MKKYKRLLLIVLLFITATAAADNDLPALVRTIRPAIVTVVVYDTTAVLPISEPDFSSTGPAT